MGLPHPFHGTLLPDDGVALTGDEMFLRREAPLHADEATLTVDEEPFHPTDGSGLCNVQTVYERKADAPTLRYASARHIYSGAG